MPKSKQDKSEYVVCVDNTGYPASLELHKIYRVVPDSDVTADGDIRVIDESGEDYVYSEGHFVPIAVPAALRESFAHAD